MRPSINVSNTVAIERRPLKEELETICNKYTRKPFTENALLSLKSELDQLSETHKDEIKNEDGAQCKLTFSKDLQMGIVIYLEEL